LIKIVFKNELFRKIYIVLYKNNIYNFVDWDLYSEIWVEYSKK